MSQLNSAVDFKHALTETGEFAQKFARLFSIFDYYIQNNKGRQKDY